MNSKDAGRRIITGADEMKWNEIMRRMWRNGGMKFMAGETEKHQENLPRLRLVYNETSWSDRDANSGPQRREASV